jgi:hypothetical protein
MKLSTRCTLAIAAVCGFALAQDTRYNFDANADFSKYKTYKWVDIKGADKPDDLVDRQIRSTLDAELAKKGLTKTDDETADLFVGYQTAINTEKEVTSFDSGWGYGPGWRYGGAAPGISTSTTSTLYVGSLAVDMYDSSKKQLVWRGVATKTLDTKAKPEKRQKNLQKATAKLLKNYPPKAS